MSDANKTLIRRVYYDLMNGRRLELADEFYSPEFVSRDPAFPKSTKGPEGIKELLRQLNRQFPDHVYSVEDVFSEGDRVAVRWKVEGTVPSKFEIRGISICHVKNGQICEVWQHWDSATLASQTGFNAKASM
ncbi:MAG TPA: ester cyclase [Terriglobia bacterium]|nr:ester cyclase [Terriglobia bacterium]